MSKERVGQIIRIVLTAVIALLAVFGYDAGVIQPRETGLDGFGVASTRGLYATLCYRPEGGASFECDSGGAYNVNSGASLTLDSGSTFTGGGTSSFTGQVTVGDGGDTVAVNSSDWDISTTGTMTGIGAITSDGALTAASAVITGALTVGGYPPVISTLATNGVGITNSVTAASNAMVFEGATGDIYQLNLVAADPASSDKTITLPNLTGEVMVSNGWDVAQGWWFQGQDLNHEGSSADGNEFTLRAPANPAADIILSAPSFSGYIATNSAAVQTIYGSNTITGTLGVTHGLTTPLYAFCAMGTDPVDDQEDRCTVTIAGATVTVKVWKEAATPTAGDSGVTVYWTVVGTP